MRIAFLAFAAYIKDGTASSWKELQAHCPRVTGFLCRGMLDAVEPMNDAAWTQWKTLHHQTKDLSPWLTEDIRAEHLRVSHHGEPSASSSKLALTQTWTSVRQKRWKVLAVIAAICRFDTFPPSDARFSWFDTSASRQVYAFWRLSLLICHPNGRRRSQSQRLYECKESQRSTTTRLKEVQYAPTRTDLPPQVSFSSICHQP